MGFFKKDTPVWRAGVIADYFPLTALPTLKQYRAAILVSFSPLLISMDYSSMLEDQQLGYVNSQPKRFIPAPPALLDVFLSYALKSVNLNVRQAMLCNSACKNSLQTPLLNKKKYIYIKKKDQLWHLKQIFEDFLEFLDKRSGEIVYLSLRVTLFPLDSGQNSKMWTWDTKHLMGWFETSGSQVDWLIFGSAFLWVVVL